MFKPLIKKVRENSNNPSILPENTSTEVGEHLNKDNKNSHTNEHSSSKRTHRRSDSNAKSLRSSSIPNEADDKEDFIKLLSDTFSPYIQEPISIKNVTTLLKSWMDSKEESLQHKEYTIHELLQETVHLQNEMATIRSNFSNLRKFKEKDTNDNTHKTSYLQKQIDTLRSDNENLKLTIKSLRTQLSDVEAERDDLLIKSADICNIKHIDDIQKEFDAQNLENERQKKEIENLREALFERDTIIEQQDRRLLVEHESEAIQTDEDRSFVQVLAEPDIDTISKLQDELNEKNRTIKNLQQRYNDLRKTLQREFQASVPKDLNQINSSKPNIILPSSPTNLPLVHYDAPATSQSDVDAVRRESTGRQMTALRKNVTFTPATVAATVSTTSTSPAILPLTPVESPSAKAQRNGHRSSIDGQTSLNSTNFKYLKHVLLKFMTATEDEAIHLIRAVSTLLNFSADEERLLRETLDYKMSWFGKVSRHKLVPSNFNF